MTGEAVWSAVWKAIVIASAGSAVASVLLARLRHRWRSLGGRVATTIGFLLVCVGSILAVNAMSESAFVAAWRRDLWVHPSPVLLLIPSLVAALAGALYFRYLRSREGRAARVA